MSWPELPGTDTFSRKICSRDYGAACLSCAMANGARDAIFPFDVTQPVCGSHTHPFSWRFQASLARFLTVVKWGHSSGMINTLRQYLVLDKFFQHCILICDQKCDVKWLKVGA